MVDDETDDVAARASKEGKPHCHSVELIHVTKFFQHDTTVHSDGNSALRLENGAEAIFASGMQSEGF